MDLSKRKDARSVRQALSLAQERGLEINKVSRHELNTLSGDKVHQVWSVSVCVCVRAQVCVWVRARVFVCVCMHVCICRPL